MSLFEAPPTTVEVKFEDLVGEGKKYRDNDAAAKAIVEKDRFIEQLQKEQAEARNIITQQSKSQEILDRLEALRETPTARDEPTQVVERVVEHKGLTIEDVDRLMVERETARRKAGNVEQVKAELVKTHGSNYPAVLNSLAVKLGVTSEYLEHMAGTSPAALLQLVQAEKPAQVFTPPSSHAPGVFNPTGGGPQKRSFYKKIMETDRARYFTPAVQNQMYKDAMVLQEEFRDIAN